MREEWDNQLGQPLFTAIEKVGRCGLGIPKNHSAVYVVIKVRNDHLTHF